MNGPVRAERAREDELMFRLPSEIPVDEYPGPRVFMEEAERLVKAAEADKILLRVMGGMAIYMRCPPEHRDTWRRLGRLGAKVFTDIDFVSYGRQRDRMVDFMKRNGYETDPHLLFQGAKNRHIFFGGRVPMVEVFYDKLAMNHTIDYAGRLETSPLTVPLEELMLQKLQIVKINDKDLKDLMILFLSHGVGKGREEIDADFVATKYMEGDWAFYYTATTNLAKVRDALKGQEALSERDRQTIEERVSMTLRIFEEVPKSMKWKMRAKVGPKMKWYDDVDEW